LITPDPDKIHAIRDMKAPTNIHQLRQLLSIINQLSKFSPFLADQTKPLRDLLSFKNQWMWDDTQAKAFTDIKNALGSSPVLGLYNPSNPFTASADASSFGVGAVLQQQQPNGNLCPIAFISKSLTDTEKRSAQIEKEAIAVTWAYKRFQDYLIGLTFSIENDHKPLVPLFSGS